MRARLRPANEGCTRGRTLSGLGSLEKTLPPRSQSRPNRRQVLHQNGHVSSVRVLLDVDADDGDVREEWVLVGGGDDSGLLGVGDVADDVGPALVRALDSGDDYASSFRTL